MATQSFLKNVNLRSSEQVNKLLNALEKSENNSDKNIAMQRAVSEAKGEQIKGIVKKIRWTL